LNLCKIPKSCISFTVDHCSECTKECKLLSSTDHFFHLTDGLGGTKDLISNVLFEYGFKCIECNSENTSSRRREYALAKGSEYAIVHGNINTPTVQLSMNLETHTIFPLEFKASAFFGKSGIFNFL
jgi:hypothetical protein